MGGKSLRKCEVCGVRRRRRYSDIFLSRFPFDPASEGAAVFGGPSARRDVRKPNFAAKREFSITQPQSIENSSNRLQVDVDSEEEVDVIDLGAPRRLRSAPPDALPGLRATRVSRIYTPNPRLYPGPAAVKPKRKRRRSCTACRRVFRRPVPNSRLYRPAPRRLPPPAAAPRGPWPPPAPLGPCAHDTASRAALHLAARRAQLPRRPLDPAPPGTPVRAPPSPRARRLVVTLPPAAGGMDAARHSASPDDFSDADALSAPSEFLAEFLSAIMRRQYAEALKYCRLILQYEPHNATARGFYPLLQHKAQALKRGELEGAAGGASSSDSSACSPAQRSPLSAHSRSLSHGRERVRHEGSGSLSRGRTRVSRSGSESGGSVASQSSLELDSSSASARASPSAASASPTSASASASARSDTRSNTRSRSDNDESETRDDNGNPPATLPNSDDLENDNDVPHIKSDSASSLRRLRAQFACSIK